MSDVTEPKNFSPTNPSEMICWPLRGFAPGEYSCRCQTCQRAFLGEKQAKECLECAIKGVKNTVAKYYDDICGLGEELNKVSIEIANPIELIVSAAIWHNGCAISLPQPARHGQVLTSMSVLLRIDATQVPPENQGFMTSYGRFVNRVEAKQIAHRAKQIIRESGSKGDPSLYSEDVW